MDLNLDDLDGLEPVAIPMTEQQRYRIQALLNNSVLNDDQIEAYQLCVDCGPTFTEAEGLIEELRGCQMDIVNLAREGKLKENGPNGMKVANREWCKRPNT